MSNKNTNSTHMSREELVKKLKENQNSEGYFTLSGSEESAEQPTDNKTLLLYSAIEKFANSLDNKPEGKTLIEMVL
jgi:hypothetical protein